MKEPGERDAGSRAPHATKQRRPLRQTPGRDASPHLPHIAPGDIEKPAQDGRTLQPLGVEFSQNQGLHGQTDRVHHPPPYRYEPGMVVRPNATKQATGANGSVKKVGATSVATRLVL